MTNPGIHCPTRVILLALVLGSLTFPAAGQNQKSILELRQENARLATELADLKDELEKARQENQALKQEVEQLREELRKASVETTGGRLPSPELQPEQITIDESVPGASPRALLKALMADYGEATAEHEIGAGPEAPQRPLYLRHLERWAAKMNRQYKLAIDWHVRLVDPYAPAVPVGRGYVLRLQAVDPETDVKLGDPFDALLSRSVATRIEERLQREGLDSVFRLMGVLGPRVHINEERLSEGAFDNPRFIGPFAEFGFVVHVKTLLPTPREQDESPDRSPSEQTPRNDR